MKRANIVTTISTILAVMLAHSANAFDPGAVYLTSQEKRPNVARSVSTPPPQPKTADVTIIPSTVQTTLDATLASKLAIILERNPQYITTNFLIVDKVQGKMSLVSPTGEVINETKVLVGRDKSDVIDTDAYAGNKKFAYKITPAGIFPVKRYKADKYGGTVLVFIDGVAAATALHRVYLGNPAQKRDKRILSDDPNVRRITNGCINVPVDFFDEVLEKLPNGTLLFVLPEQAKTTEQFLNYVTIAK